MNALSPELRPAILARMVSLAPNQKLGRTQLMKLFYFLQALKGVYLGYDFRLFNYGPFDSEVLYDLSAACAQKYVTEHTVTYSGGYGYAIQPGPQSDRGEAELQSLRPELVSLADDVVREFGGFSAAQLELRSTILYVEREFADKGSVSSEQIVQRVRLVKPHFEDSVIRSRVTEMAKAGHLQSLDAPAVPSH